MPALLQTYDILLDFTNDTNDYVSIQLSRDYGRNTDAILLLRPSETVTLVLDSGSVYRYAVKTGSGSVYKVADIIARSWSDIHCNISYLFAGRASSDVNGALPANGVVVDRLWRDYKMCIWSEH